MAEPLIIVDHPRRTVTLVTLNRPAKRNALSTALMEAVCEAVAAADADATQRALILNGAGPVFCAGLDLAEAAASDNFEHTARLVARMFQTLARSRLVTITAVHGAAVAGGAGLMSATDLAIAAEGTLIGYPEVRRGLVAGMVASFLVRQVGQRAARELLLLGRPIPAERAKEVGLLNAVVPPGQLLDAALALAEEARQAAPGAVAHTKRILAELTPGDLSDDLSLSMRHFVTARQSAEADEGLRAFLEKRPPRWSLDEEGEVKP